MASNKESLESESVGDQNLPLVLLHSRPPFNISLDRLLTQFHFIEHDVSQEPATSFLSRHAHSVTAMLCMGFKPVTSQTIALLPSLLLIVGSSAGLDFVDKEECRRRRITLTNASLAFAEDAADYAVALLIDVLRGISAADRFVRASSWPVKGDYPLGSKLGGKRVGIIGLGSIGSEVAKRMVAFGCRVAYNSRRRKPSVPFPYYANVKDLAADSEVLILCCPKTEETHHIINEEVMRTLGQEGVIINVGRGSLIDQKELVKFLVEGKIGGAGLDVFEKEPDVPKELFSLDNVVLSPHSAVVTPESTEAVMQLILFNLNAFFANQPLKSIVHLE